MHKMFTLADHLAICTGVILIFLYLSFLLYQKFKAEVRKTALPTNWPVVGMMPGLLLNSNRLHDFTTDILEEAGGTFLVKGPWFSNMDMMLTSDPANVHYILSKNFQNFSKGPEFKKIFDVLGDGIFIAEAEHWENQRKTTATLIKHPDFLNIAANICWEKIESGLNPILDHVAEMGEEVDLQELFKRFAFDCTCIQVLGNDPCSLREDLPYLPHEKAFADAEEAILLRHVLPEITWKLQEWLRIGREHKLTDAKKAMDKFLSYCLSLKQNNRKTDQVKDEFDLLIGFMRTFPGSSNVSDDSWKYMMLNFVFAGKDTVSATLTWFFWLIAEHPEEQKKIREEIFTNLSVNEGGKWKFTNIDELKKLSHLHGALCETLRLFPPVAFQHKAPAEPDTLPSGHKINANTRTLLSFYSMGRTQSIWGQDCLEFKPERWISETGCIRTVPFFKFPAFNGGPRSCLGKEISLLQMKIVAAAIINLFHIQVAEGHPVALSASAIIHMKYGLKVKISHTISN